MKKLFAFCLAIITLFITLCCTACAPDKLTPFNNKNTKMIAHRGLSGIAIENTVEAFTLAGEHSYYGIETDVRITADGKFIICHDETLERIAGKDIVVEETTLSELLKVPLSMSDRPGTAYLCELGTYVEICKQYNKHAILELKSKFNIQQVGQIIDIISSYDYLDNTTFISFKYENVAMVRELLPNQSVQHLVVRFKLEVAEKLVANKIDVSADYRYLRKQDIDYYHNAGLKVGCWTVDNKLIAQYLVWIGVDYITTNILE